MKIKKLKKLVDKLQEWINSTEGLSRVPVANFEYCNGGEIIVRVGEFVVWDSLDDGPLNFKNCKKRFTDFVGQFSRGPAEEMPIAPPEEEFAPPGVVVVKCVYFKDNGKHYANGQKQYPADLFKGCIYPREYGEMLNSLEKLPGIEGGKWGGPFTVCILEPACYDELVLGETEPESSDGISWSRDNEFTS